MKKVLPIVFIFFLILILSCNWGPVDPDDNDDITDTTEVWPDPILFDSHDNLNMFPVDVGNYWSHKFQYWSASTGYDTANVYRTISYKKTFNDIEYFAFNIDMPFFPDNFICDFIAYTDTVFFRVNESGDFLILIDEIEWPYFIFDSTLLDSIYPLNIQDVIYYSTMYSINDTVITNIDTFYNCMLIKSVYPSVSGSSHFTWFAPNYGPVKIYYPELNTTYELTDLNTGNK